MLAMLGICAAKKANLVIPNRRHDVNINYDSSNAWQGTGNYGLLITYHPETRQLTVNTELTRVFVYLYGAGLQQNEVFLTFKLDSVDQPSTLVGVIATNTPGYCYSNYCVVNPSITIPDGISEVSLVCRLVAQGGSNRPFDLTQTIKISTNV